ncbi:hypothetical protein MBRU_05700 [Mycolicibacterium brumae DSM 44177]|nr:hypothetical protein MBRU_05700 [Mycolicibacterium brumae DSM 44177]
MAASSSAGASASASTSAVWASAMASSSASTASTGVSAGASASSALGSSTLAAWAGLALRARSASEVTVFSFTSSMTAIGALSPLRLPTLTIRV